MSLQHALDTNCIFRVPWRADVSEAREWLDKQPSQPGPHVRSSSEGFACYRPEVVLKAPGLLGIFNAAGIVSAIGEWLGYLPTLYSVNAWWSYATEEPRLWHAQMFHRDTDTPEKFLTLFIALSNVGPDNGPFQIIPGIEGENGQGLEFSRHIEETHAEKIITATGPSGTLWLADTRALHRGLLPKEPRLMAWARYGSGPNSNSIDLDMRPLPWSECPLDDTPRNRHVNRLLFA